MSTAVREMHAFDAAVEGRPRAVQGQGSRPRPSSAARKCAWPSRRCPGLMALRARYKGKKPLAGARVMGSLHMTIQTAVLIETLDRARRRRALGVVQHLLDAGSRRRRGRRRPSRDRRHAGRTRRASPVFAWKGETLDEYWWCTSEALMWPDGSGPTQIVDDGGDATLLVHKGVEFEKAGKVPGVQRRRAIPRSGASSSSCCARS